ncbi:MAG: ABC transporter ATP-binding protein [Armatimonadota bacterium]
MSQSEGRLTLSSITKHYTTEQGDTPILKDISLTVEPGETLAIIGPSGSGKSTLLNIIGSLDKPTSGTVMIDATDVTALEGDALAAFRAKQVGFVFQEHHLLPQLTAVENVMLPSIPAGCDSTASKVAQSLLERVGVSHRAEAFPAQMSGGERQRTAVARALVNGARLLLCDEPTGSLDRDSGANIIALLLELAETQGVTVIIVTHNLEHARKFHRCMKLVDGQLVNYDPHTDHGAVL